ncbi:four-carbon acid sugar kinase family protein [Ornithinimicrobium pratense]|uniref:Four-carbon acid sugar kinase family protein n=1 Tax=Ornithinimicrobium pratense TaxID=2593973 RepID=A0A5J6V658_9MICO|nr:four-carbon acid sugar kinase family protein [Ornithinimicrobium pratense]QFG69258.1 four-carbon acid sugar kinase family protein [Ornithinimicrobium pratense]
MANDPSSASRRIAVIADDLTGATDSVVQFREAGWTAYLLLTDEEPVQEDASGVVATSRSLDTRALTSDQAAESTRLAVSEQLSAGTDRLYVKIDSTMRGSVAGQVAGALAAWSETHPDAVAVICPAYPQMGRVVAGGSMLVNGTPLDQSAASFDPVTPVSSAVLAELVPGAESVPNGGTATDLGEALRTAAQSSDRLVVDAETDDDLRRLAEAVEILGPRAICVGSAGWARYLAEVWRPAGSPDPTSAEPEAISGTVVVSASTLNEVSFDQISHLRTVLGERHEQHEFRVDQLQDPAGMRHLGRSIANRQPEVVILQPSPARVEGVDAAEAARAIARGLAAAIGGMTATGGIDALVLVGGDGAEAALRELGATAVRIDRQASEGVPLGHIVGGPAAGLPVVTKAGGFGSTTTLTDVIGAMRHPEED